jgi:hypothetical protein
LLLAPSSIETAALARDPAHPPLAEPTREDTGEIQVPDSVAAPRLTSSFADRVRQNLLNDDLLDQHFAYRVLRRWYDVSFLGKVSNGPEQAFEVAPCPTDPKESCRRLVAVDGKPVPTEQLRQEASEAKRDGDRETPSERGRRVRQSERDRREAAERLADAIRVYRFEAAGHEIVDGRRLLLVTLVPRPEAEVRSDVGKHMKKFRGRAWVDEGEAQLVRIDVEAIEDVTLGLGIIGRLHKGSSATYRRTSLPDGTWVPVEARFSGTGKTLMLRSFHIETWAKYMDYRRVSGISDAPSSAAGRN